MDTDRRSVSDDESAKVPPKESGIYILNGIQKSCCIMKFLLHQLRDLKNRRIWRCSRRGPGGVPAGILEPSSIGLKLLKKGECKILSCFSLN